MIPYEWAFGYARMSPEASIASAICITIGPGSIEQGTCTYLAVGTCISVDRQGFLRCWISYRQPVFKTISSSDACISRACLKLDVLAFKSEDAMSCRPRSPNPIVFNLGNISLWITNIFGPHRSWWALIRSNQHIYMYPNGSRPGSSIRISLLVDGYTAEVMYYTYMYIAVTHPPITPTFL